MAYVATEAIDPLLTVRIAAYATCLGRPTRESRARTTMVEIVRIVRPSKSMLPDSGF